MTQLIDLTGRVFGLLEVKELLPERDNTGKVRYRCECKCGNYSYPRGADLVSGRTKSCGCQEGNKLGRPKRHGMSYTHIYRIWTGMKTRCLNINREAHSYYGGRGISVCNRWLIFDNFYADMGDPPSNNHQIDRINNDGNYEPANCRWVLTDEQNRNKRDTIKIVFNGEKMCLAEACRVVGAKYSLISQRLKSKTNWSFEEAIKEPSGKGKVLWRTMQ